MAEKIITYARDSVDAAFGPLSRSFDITPSATELETHTRAISVEEDATITGIMRNDEQSFTTHTLKAGILYPFEWKVISAVSAGTVKGYA